VIGEPSGGRPVMGIRARRGNNIKGLETSAECKTQAAFWNIILDFWCR